MKLELMADYRRVLRAEAHHLQPVVMIGNDGLTPAVLHEIDLNLLSHGLIKIRVFSDDREVRRAWDHHNSADGAVASKFSARRAASTLPRSARHNCRS